MELFEKKTFIIAEAGVNHNGSVEIAKRLIEVAAKAGADAVKFQTFNADKLVISKAQKADYQISNTGIAESQWEMLKKLQLQEEDFIELKKYCDTVGIMFLSTPFDIDSFRFLLSIGISMIKVPSGEITNYPLLREIGKSRLKVILSTGMCELGEVQAAVRVLRKFGTTEIIVLQCNTEYPTPIEDANIKAMMTIGQKTGCYYGYSDHTLGNTAAIAAVALGACVVEKHFTLDKTMEGPDHKASIEPYELESLVSSIRDVEKVLGSGEKRVSNSERKNINVVRKSIVAKHHISKGDYFTEDNLTTKRPGTGISPMCWNLVIGTIATRNYEQDELIEIRDKNIAKDGK